MTSGKLKNQITEETVAHVLILQKVFLNIFCKVYFNTPVEVFFSVKLQAWVCDIAKFLRTPFS